MSASADRPGTEAGFSIECAAILFDLDGVLVDSTARVAQTWERWARKHQLDPARVIAAAHGRRTIETVQIVAPHLAATDEVATLEASESIGTEGVFEIPGAREILASLPPDSWAIVTSGIRAVATLRIRHTHLPMPKVLVCAEDIQHGKPHPEGYLTAAQRLGVDPTGCVVIEDTPPGLEAARAGGMRSIGVCGTYAADALSTADYTIPHLEALKISRAKNGRLLHILAATP
jgi:sugar-phosphatase